MSSCAKESPAALVRTGSPITALPMNTHFTRLLAAFFILNAASAVYGQTGYEPYSFKTLAGLSPGKIDGKMSAARFQYPNAVATDAAGNIYVADSNNHTIRKVTPAGTVTTIAGLAGSSGYAEGEGSAARFSYPDGIVVGEAGALYVTDLGNAAIRKITAEGVVSTFVGGSAGTGSEPGFVSLRGIARDTAGNLYVTDSHSVRKVTAGGQISTVAGNVSGLATISPAAARVSPASAPNALRSSDRNHQRRPRRRPAAESSAVTELLAGRRERDTSGP